jgi:signal transduction histidine kinase
MTVTEIQQVIFNMLQNSAQAMRKESSRTKSPKINIRVNTDVEWIKIEIEDNGPGMDEKVRLRVFEPFFTTKEIGEGTGLGLSVSYMIIRNNHDGKIEVSSLPGIGTKFLIKLPLLRRKHE